MADCSVPTLRVLTGFGFGPSLIEPSDGGTGALDLAPDEAMISSGQGLPGPGSRAHLRPHTTSPRLRRDPSNHSVPSQDRVCREGGG